MNNKQTIRSLEATEMSFYRKIVVKIPWIAKKTNDGGFKRGLHTKKPCQKEYESDNKSSSGI
uniref:Uncharacterized protein n=1 Tax=Arion vulgaris TaxID=1028688 RepID=A0A0B6XVX3_9EUPU